MAQKKEQLIKKNVLARHEWDEKIGVTISNDFLQLSKVVEELKDSNPKAYATMLTLIKDKLELEAECRERGKRISILQRKSND